MKTKKGQAETTNSRIYRLTRREEVTGCSLCPAHGGENSRRPKRPSKPKKKDKRK